ncbi:DUF4160 domain-containing protein [Aureimonas glaciei]|uniref:DUF4160 domain-containing protein n=1 Tax=Aureimonas glaciei TaxID=1776957 RepID=A0A917D9J9_9HYPH|nr:DUF4160 domain-containing protein [Aureimonas glaciei]GGD14010.1 hypothetical protein GCM10011335_15970 [Aureimonas glaciei]
MVTVLRALGLSVRIYKDDHPPAHVHVRYGGGMAKIDLAGPENLPILVWTRGLNSADARHVLDYVAENRPYLLARWEEIHGA